jgi:CRP/FNR family transcriptional regulator, cyclic AMP receptor protein
LPPPRAVTILTCMTVAQREVAPARGRTNVLEADPGLGDRLDLAQFDHALQSSVAATLSIDTGPWAAPDSQRPAGWLGMLVLDGMLSRRVTVAGRGWTELIGAGDLIQPWVRSRETEAAVPVEAEWCVLTPTTLAVLDRNFVLRMAPWPEVIAAATERLVERMRSLTYALAVCGRIGVAERLVLTLRHFADRWGRVTAEGIMIELPGVTHEVLAGQVGAARPSVTTALGELRERGLVRQLPNGGWLLAPEP